MKNAAVKTLDSGVFLSIPLLLISLVKQVFRHSFILEVCAEVSVCIAGGENNI